MRVYRGHLIRRAGFHATLSSYAAQWIVDCLNTSPPPSAPRATRRHSRQPDRDSPYFDPLQWHRLLCLSGLPVSFDSGRFCSSKPDSIAGSPDINTQIALQFAPRYPIALLCDDQHNLDQTVKAVQDTGGEVVLFRADFSTNEHLPGSIAAVTNRFGKRCATAIFQLRNESSARPFLEQTGVDIRKGAVLPIAGAYAFAQLAVPLLLNHADGSGYPPTLMFAGTSGNSYADEMNDNALVALHRSLGREFGKKGIHICHIKYKKGLEASLSDPNPEFVSHPEGIHISE